MIPAMVPARCGSIAGAVVAAALATLVEHRRSATAGRAGVPGSADAGDLSQTPGRRLHSGRLHRHRARLFRRLLVAGPRRAGVAGGARTSRRGSVGQEHRGPRSARLRDLQGARGRSSTATDRRRRRAFDRYDAAAVNPCGVSATFGDVVIGSASGIDDIGQAGIGVLDPPIVAQNGRYVRTLTLFNQIAFDHIVRNRFFLRSALPPVPRPRPERPVIEFPMGSIAVKTAWIDVTDLPAPLVKRFYTRHRAREARRGRRMRADDGRTHRPAHRAEDAEPPAMDLVVVRAEGRRAAEVGRLARRVRAERWQRRADAGAQSAVARAAGARARAAVQRRARRRRADSDGHRADQLRLSAPAGRHAVAALPAGGHAVAAASRGIRPRRSRPAWTAASRTRSPARAPSRRSRTSRWRRSIRRACSSGA